MKNITTHLFKFSIFSVVLLSNFMMYSQAPGDDTAAGDLEGTDAAPAPINDYLWILVLVGLAFVFYKYRAYSKQQNA